MPIVTSHQYSVVHSFRLRPEGPLMFESSHFYTKRAALSWISQLKHHKYDHIELISEPCVLNSVCIYWDRDQQTGNYTKTDLS